MPATPRPQGKAKKIAYKILGIPAQRTPEPTSQETQRNRRLMYEETSRIR